MISARTLLPIAVALLATPVLTAADPASVCTAARIKATAKKTSAKLRCHAMAAAHDRAVDDGCLASAEAKFSAAWARIEARGGCPATTDEATMESKVDAYVTDVVTTVSFGPTTTLQQCGVVGGVCGGACPQQMYCFEIGVGCHGEPEPCRCHGSTTTCPPPSSSTSTTLP